MTFSAGDPVLWLGEPCAVLEARGDRVALRRERDGFTIITVADVLAAMQPAAPVSHSLLGDAL